MAKLTSSEKVAYCYNLFQAVYKATESLDSPIIARFKGVEPVGVSLAYLMSSILTDGHVQHIPKEQALYAWIVNYPRLKVGACS